ncbi:MAG: RadC family protein [Clostridia bacterium]|nr:RadC family protein [Clostridia bacterium]
MEHAGHRKRLIEKLGMGSLPEHEVLEALLFNAVPRINTNDLAHRLLARFGTVPAVLGAPLRQLKEVEGVGDSLASYLRCIGTFCERYYAEYRDRFPKTYEQSEFSAYVYREYAYLQDEVLDCFLVERSGKILQRRRFSANAQDFATVKPEDMTAVLGIRGVAGVVLVHNHPGARSTPSQADNELTKQIQWMCSFHNLLFCDHIVCGYDGVYSYYQDGKLGDISRTCSIRQLLAEGNYGKD